MAIRSLRTLRAMDAIQEKIRAEGTNALRIVDTPTIEIDEFAGHWLVQSRMHERYPADLVGENPAGAIYWKPLGEKLLPQHISGPKLDEPFVAMENNLRYWIDFTAGYSQGLFIDQRDNRTRLRAEAAGRTLLNCFSYTCAFGVALAASGAHTTNLDLSKRHLDWGRRNYELNNLDPAAHGFIFGDVAEWLARFAKKGRQFDIIVLDPPTFSRDAKGRVFTIEGGFPGLVAAAARILSPDGKVLCSTNQRSLSASAFRQLVTSALPSPRRWTCEPLSMPLDFSGEKYLKAMLLTGPCASSSNSAPAS